MRCRVKNCIHNEDGYCYRASYVEIDENGECDEMNVPTVVDEGKDDET